MTYIYLDTNLLYPIFHNSKLEEHIEYDGKIESKALFSEKLSSLRKDFLNDDPKRKYYWSVHFDLKAIRTLNFIHFSKANGQDIPIISPLSLIELERNLNKKHKFFKNIQILTHDKKNVLKSGIELDIKIANTSIVDWNDFYKFYESCPNIIDKKNRSANIQDYIHLYFVFLMNNGPRNTQECIFLTEDEGILRAKKEAKNDEFGLGFVYSVQEYMKKIGYKLDQIYGETAPKKIEFVALVPRTMTVK